MAQSEMEKRALQTLERAKKEIVKTRVEIMKRTLPQNCDFQYNMDKIKDRIQKEVEEEYKIDFYTKLQK